MPIIVSNIREPLGRDKREAEEAALKSVNLLGCRPEKVYIVKNSPDFRHRAHACMVYTVGIELETQKQEEAVVKSAASRSVTLRQKTAFTPKPGSAPLHGRPVIAGFGPAGMFAGLMLARYGYRPLIVERGSDVDKRVREVERFWKTGVLNERTNVQFGEGGAGTFSDGKLVTRINDPLCETVLAEFVNHGAPEEIRYLAKPHIGTDKLRGIVKSIRADILKNGGEIRFDTGLEQVHTKNGRLSAVDFEDGTLMEPGALILAIGHSARNTFEMLAQAGVMLVPKPFSVGVRIEHLQSSVDRGLFGSLAGHPGVPKGEYQFSLRRGGEAVYTFCMCPGGTVVAAASQDGGVVTNGMSVYRRDGVNANAALVASVGGFASPAESVRFQRELEQAAYAAGESSYRAPFQTAGSFLGQTDRNAPKRVQPSYPVGVAPARLDRILPAHVVEMLRLGLRAFDRKMPGFAAPDTLLTGVETRTSSPIRIVRNESYEALNRSGLYPAGEGAGYAGGIVSSAVDGCRVAGAIIAKFAPPD